MIATFPIHIDTIEQFGPTMGWWWPLTFAIFIIISSVAIFFLKGDAGKRIFRLVIISMKYGKYERASFWQILMRTAIKYVSIIFPLLFLFVFFNWEHLFLHGYLAKTEVISRKEAAYAGIIGKKIGESKVRV